METVKPISFLITSPNLTSKSEKFYLSVGLNVVYKHPEMTISNSDKSVIVIAGNFIIVNILDYSVIKMLNKNINFSIPMYFVDESGMSVKVNYDGKFGYNTAILTSGGDAPGMNTAIRAIVRKSLAEDKNSVIYGIKNGFEGLTFDYFYNLHWEDVANNYSQGGTFLLSARSKRFMEYEGRRDAVYNLAKRNIHGIYIIGGDGSMKGALKLSEEYEEHINELKKVNKLDNAYPNEKIKVVVIPASIDNDIYGTDCTLGADSALTRVTECVDSLWTTMASHQRAFVIEVMGRKCGWIALMAALACGADYVFLPEQPHEDWENELKQNILRARSKGKLGTIIMVCEGTDIDLNKIKEKVEDIGIETRIVSLGHIQRGGRPCAYDRILGTLSGCKAVECMKKEDKNPTLVIKNKNVYESMPLKISVDENRKIGEMLSSKMYDDVMEKRGNLFNKAYELIEQLRKGCVVQNNVEKLFDYKPEKYKLKNVDRKEIKDVEGRLAVLCEGSRVGGMDYVLHTVVRYASSLNQKVFLIDGGFEGLLKGNISEEKPYDYANFPYQRVIDLGRAKESDIDSRMIYNKLVEHRIKGLIVVGGRNALNIINNLNLCFEEIQSKITAKNEDDNIVPTIILIPASIENDLPFINLSLGADTALNAIINGCEYLHLNGNTTKKRLFVVEVPGKNSGYLAVMSSLASAAFDCLIPELQQNIYMLGSSIARLQEKMKTKKNQRYILIKNQKAYKGISIESLANLIHLENRERFDIKCNVFGYLSEGASTSPIDRIIATSLAAKAVDMCLKKKIVSIIGLLGDKIVVYTLESALKELENYKLGEKLPYWLNYIDIVRALE